MSFKADASFLRFLSMGAIGVRQTIAQLRSVGFQPIELERYCTSNKLWATKVKRLRLPDVLCVRTGLRLEIRAKSDLSIKMSDAENNEARRWDAGLRDDDVAAFIAVANQDGTFRAAQEAIFFDFKDLRESVSTSKLGAAKSASEGAEKDREWPSCTPSRDGVVLSVDTQKITAQLSGGDRPSRLQSYRLGGKSPYVTIGDTFKGGETIIAATPAKRSNLSAHLSRRYDPLLGLQESTPVDRYAAAKALPYRDDLSGSALQALETALANEAEPRVALEMAGSAAKLNSQIGQARLLVFLEDQDNALRMEAIFILTELRDHFAETQLLAIAVNSHLEEGELRQAAIWGLGKAGLKAYERIVSFIADADDDVAMHAMVSFGHDTPESILGLLIRELIDGNARKAAAASEALRLSASQATVRLLLEPAITNDWAFATLGRLPAELVRPLTNGTPLGARLAPMLLLSEGAHWLSSEDKVLDIAFLAKQNLF